MSKIRIERNSEWNNKVRKIRIYVNGIKVGAISNGETQQYQLEPGTHEVFAKIDWCGSQKLLLNLSENETTTLKLKGYKYGTWTLPIVLGLFLIHFLAKIFLDINLYFLLLLGVFAFLYSMYFITFGRNNYLILTAEK